MVQAHLPVLGLELQQHGVLLLILLALVSVLGLLDALLSLDAVILGKGALVAGAAGMGEEVRADGLDAPLGGTRQLANGFEVLVGTPALSEGRQRQFNRSDGSHDYRLKDMANNGEEGKKRGSLETT